MRVPQVSRFSRPGAVSAYDKMLAMASGKGKVKGVALFVVHQLISPYLLVAISAALTMSLLPTKAAHWLLTETPYFPVQILMGLIAGFVVGKRPTLPLARWMWVIPSLCLLLALVFLPIPAGQGRFDHFFGWAGLPQHRQYDEVALTLPFYVALAYSCAASLGGRRVGPGLRVQ